MDILKNNDRYLFDWKSDAGASEGSIFAMGTGAYFVQVFSGILDKDGASWSQLIDSFYLKMDSYDRKYDFSGSAVPKSIWWFQYQFEL